MPRSRNWPILRVYRFPYVLYIYLPANSNKPIILKGDGRLRIWSLARKPFPRAELLMGYGAKPPPPPKKRGSGGTAAVTEQSCKADVSLHRPIFKKHAGPQRRGGHPIRPFPEFATAANFSLKFGYLVGGCFRILGSRPASA